MSLAADNYGAFNLTAALNGIYTGTPQVRINEGVKMNEGTVGGHETKGRLFTRAQQVKGGWVGQIVLDGKTVVFESEPCDDVEGISGEQIKGSKVALDEANDKLVEGYTKLFS